MTRAAPLPPDERRAALMAATEPLLEVHGRAVSTRQIAEAAGVAEGTIFRVFPTKEALIDAVVVDAFDAQVTCDEIALIDEDLDLEDRLLAGVGILQTRLRRVFALFHSLSLARSQEDFRDKQETDNALLNAALASVLKPDQHRLRLDVEQAAGLIRTVTFAMTHPILSDPLLSTPRHVVDLVLHGIAIPPTTTHPPTKNDHDQEARSC